MIKKINILFVCLVIIFISNSYAQDTFVDTLNCQGGTPTYIVDLSSNGDSLWLSNNSSRAGDCCAGADNGCVQFAVNLSSDVVALKFDIPEGGQCGAKPSGSLFYQIDCGPLTSIETTVCIGPGEHVITFCKPGGNKNCYSIQSISTPEVSPPISVNDGCVGTLGTSGFDDTTIVWRSIFPGNIGDYNSYLDCTEDCDTVTVTAQPGFPPYVDYEVCGKLVGGCIATPECHTIRAYFHSTLAVDINPANPTVCFGDAGTTITAVPTGGTTPYEYLWSTGETTQTIFVDVGTYSIQLSDTTGCPPTFDNVTVTEFLNIITAEAGGDITVCSDETSVALSGNVIAASGGIWKGGNGSFSATATDLNASYLPTAGEIASGSVDLYLLTTGNGTCPADSDSVVVNFVNFSSVLMSDVSNVSCFGGNNGTATVSTSSGVTPYYYQWFNGSTQQSVNNLSAGTYNVTVTDGYSCDSVVVVTITEPTILTVTLASQTSTSCYGSSDGSADITASGGSAPYSYLWDNGSAIEDANDLNAGSHIVTVTDNKGCIANLVVTIVEPNELLVTISNINSTCGTNNGSLTANPWGGTPPYSYLWSNSGNTQNINGLSAGFYYVTVTDNNGCIAENLAGISDPVPLTDIVDSTVVSCFGGNDGTAEVSANSGTTPYAYNWSNGENTPIAVNLTAGIHTVTVSDDVGCRSVEQVLILQPTLLVVNATKTNASCYGYSDGTGTATASGGNSGYTYLWSDGQIGASVSGFATGVYTVTATDTKSCKAVRSITITEPTGIELDTIFKNISCKGGNDGFAEVTGTGGTPPYTYLWSTASTSFRITGLTIGNYFVSVFDNNSCVQVTSVSLTEPTFALNVTTSHVDIDCYGNNNGTATAIPSGGMSPYTYLWDALLGSQGTQSVSALSAGVYGVTVYDANLCDVNNKATVTITQPSAPLAITLTPKDVSCFGNNDGTISSNVTGGTAPYTYSWSSGQVIPNLSSLGQGTYTVTVTDNKGCKISSSASIIEPQTLFATLQATSITCNGQSNGSITVAVTGGSTPFTYEWTNGNNTSNNTNLIAGTYQVTITDLNNCKAIESDVVVQPQLLSSSEMVTNASCQGGNDGVVTLSASGGISPYSYQWDVNAFFQASATATSLPAGSFVATITDKNNCVYIHTTTVGEPTAIGLITTPQLDTLCPGETALIGALATGSNGGFTYSWNNGLGDGPSKSVSPTQSIVYNVTATDQLGCVSLPASVTVNVINYDITGLKINENGPICDGETAKIVSSYTEQYPPYQYQWDNGLGTSLGTFSVSPNVSTMYHLTITDQCGNRLKDSIQVVVYELPNAEVIPSINDGCAPLTVSFVNGIGGVNIVSYQWDFGDGLTSLAEKPDHTYELAGEYEVVLKVVSDEGCENTTSPPFTITVYPLPEAGIIADPKNTDLDDPTIDFTSTSIGANQYLWSFGDGDSSSVENISHTYQDTGHYVVTLLVKNQFGCIDSSFENVYIGPTYKLLVPNAFMPNIEGPNGGVYDKNNPKNQVFFPKTDYISEYHLMVFNRWGEMIFESFDINIGWDGYYRGKLCQQDVYVWKINITYTDGKQETQVGEVHLIR